MPLGSAVIHARHFGLGLLFGIVLFAAVSDAAEAEMFVLHNGGHVAGKLLNPDESPRKQFVVESIEGGRITLDVSQVKRILRMRPEELEYEKVRTRYNDTAEDHWVMAEWCLQKRLLVRRKKHLERICELYPNHPAARHALGQEQVGDQWLTRDQQMAKQGYQRFGGRYRTSQEIDLLRRQHARENAEKEWFVKIKLWRNWLETTRDPAGRGNLNGITDPNAVAALDKALGKEDDVTVRLMYVKILAAIGTPGAYGALKTCSMENDSERVRLASLDYLAKVKSPALTKYYIGKLRDRKQHKTIQRAAVALSRVGDSSAVRPLLDALITTRSAEKSSLGSLGSLTTGFAKGGASNPGLLVGGSPKRSGSRVRNEFVRDALCVLTGQNFGFDQGAWQDWYVSQEKVRKDINLRRD